MIRSLFPLWLTFLAVSAVAFLSGCSPATRTVYQPVEVKVPVMVPCVTPDDMPVKPGPLPAMPQDANRALSLSLALNYMWADFGAEVEAILSACAGEKRSLASGR